MSEKQVVESTIELSTAGASVTYHITALDDQGTTLDATTLVVATTSSIWGGFLWGLGLWSASINIPHVYTIEWNIPLVFQKMAIQVSGTSSSNIRIGTFFARWQDLGYMNQR
jgi:hypothetical protein